MNALHEKPVYKTQWVINKFENDAAFVAGKAYATEVIDVAVTFS